nr:AAA family ATPase [Candidatus Aminicenantes bacterium]NIM82765.1 AAA family ATPase [Candidatus Aminicenantes bacterium]NIN22141.1 AAA family ATPase [Candidatus Aminicenantes bacterium]NIN45898.1 AAA family ATPase [Candidatus Aminicenantes bacterium]NIN88737.1 AAA family ATPase [Candidatus Aminicenantes bacterium]
MKDKNIKKIPYGLANYERVVEKNCYYVDKTMFLEVIENTSDYLFFIRPRRFGKSLFLSVME